MPPPVGTCSPTEALSTCLLKCTTKYVIDQCNCTEFPHASWVFKCSRAATQKGKNSLWTSHISLKAFSKFEVNCSQNCALIISVYFEAMIREVIDTINQQAFRLFFPLDFGYLSIKTLPMKSNLPDWDLISYILSIFVWIFQKSFRVIVILQTTYPLREILVKIYTAISWIILDRYFPGNRLHLRVLS